jgi:PKHD-type hydroxylase
MFFVFPRAVKIEVCDQIVADCKQNILKQASILSSDKKGRDDPDIRKTSVDFITDKNNKINELAWHFLREANKLQFHYELTFFQAIQFAEYKDGGFYEWHQDASGIDPSNETRKLSLTLVLSNPDNFEGGELQFYNGGRPLEDIGNMTAKQLITDIKSQGTVIVFDSRDWHRVTPVTKGVRHSIVCWTLGPNFK